MSEFLDAMQEAADILTGDRLAAREHHFEDVDVRAIRRKLKLSQATFADRFGFEITSVRAWEAGRSRPGPPLRSYLLVIAREPGAVERALRTQIAA